MVIGVDPLRATLAVVALSDSVKVPETREVECLGFGQLLHRKP